MSSEIIKVPDIGGSEDVEIIEVAVSAGDIIEPEDTLITLESDKASMDVPSPKGGKVVRVLVKEGDTVSEGDDIVELELEGSADDSDTADESAASAEAEPEAASEQETAPSAEEFAAEKPAAKTSGGGGKRSVEIKVPDLGGASEVEVIEVPVSEGDEVAEEDALITLESDKASMDVPSPHSGKLVSLTVKEGDTVSEGDVIGTMEITGEGGDEENDADEAAVNEPEKEAVTGPVAEGEAGAAEEVVSDAPERREIRVPDLSGASDVPVIEIAVSAGDELEEEDALITLESDKASMDVPSPYKGKLIELTVKEGDSVSPGDLIGYMEVAGGKPRAARPQSTPEKASSASSESSKPAATETPAETPSPEAEMAEYKPRSGKLVHAGPAVRMLARELGVDLVQVKPSGPKERVLKEDVHAYVKQVMAGQAQAPAAAAAGGAGIPVVPDQDFSQFGAVEEKPMGRLMKMGATNLHRSWLNVPHVTQFDEADITELEAFRQSMKAEAEAQGAKLTPLPFLIKASAFALRKFPQFNVSLKSDGETLVWKDYVHIGIAVDTPDGLMVPVIRDADRKSLVELAKESVELAGKAQSKKLKREEMTGGCFTISSLGSIGGTAFTPIVNTPEVAILGVSRAQMKPVWNGADFEPRLMMPLSLSYDHRAVNGADAARFAAFLTQVLGDLRRLLM